MLHIYIISIPSINWKEFLEYTSQSIKRNPLETMDNKGIKFTKKLPDFLSIMKEIANPKSNPLNNAGFLLEHLSFIFGVTATKSTIWNIITNTRLAATTTVCSQPEFAYAIISGTLMQWQTTILNCCHEDMNSELRIFGDKALDLFESMGLKMFMQTMTRSPLPDGTIKLIKG